MMRLLRAEAHRLMAWKNGGGFTTEVAAFPRGASVDGFGWRISMAAVREDGPFSAFPGIYRTLTVLEGEGIALVIEGQSAVELTRASAPFGFPGDVPTAARLLGGPILDLNVMTRRGAFAHRVSRQSGRGAVDVAPDVAPSGGVTLVLSREPALGVDCGDDGDRAVLAMDDAVILDRPARLTPSGQGAFFIIELWASEPVARH